MNHEWHQFTDSYGINNSYPTPIRGLEFHVHGVDFNGPASLKYGNDTIANLTPGEALYRTAMIEFNDRYFG